MIENGTLLQNRYLIEKQIGAGGMGAVYLAVDQRFGSYVAIKETFYKDRELGDAFEREAHLLNSLHHPVLPHVSDYFTENNDYFLVMQYIEGEDLLEILKRDGAFPVKDVVRWTDNLLDALDYLHSQTPPIIHRDIKPQNLKITARGDVILLDFGLAKLKSDDSSDVKSVFGYSKKYSPLEQIQGTGTDVRSDIFSLAATAYHLLTGKPPIDVLARAAEIVVGHSDPLWLANEMNPNVPVEIANVLNVALALNSAGRFQSAKAMRQALDYAAGESPIENGDVPPLPVIIPAGAEIEIVNTAGTENFPALEAFAADIAVPPVPEPDGEPYAREVVSVGDEKALSTAPPPPAAAQTVIIDRPAAASPAVSAARSRVPAAAALVVLLVCVGLTAGYFINKSGASGNTNQSAEVEREPAANLNIEQTAIAADSPEPQTSDTPQKESVVQSKPKPREVEEAVGKTEESGSAQKVADASAPTQNNTAEKSKSEPAQSVRTQTPAKTPRRAQPTATAARRQEAIADDNDPNNSAPDIESIFTGRTPEEREERLRRQQERRQPRDDMSDEERQELRRQRRERRRQRQNIPPNLPF